MRHWKKRGKKKKKEIAVSKLVGIEMTKKLNFTLLNCISNLFNFLRNTHSVFSFVVLPSFLPFPLYSFFFFFSFYTFLHL